MNDSLNLTAARVLSMCKKRKWSLHWTTRGTYLHLESSELIESLRGKGDSSPTTEAGDVLMVLMSITENEGIPFDQVISALRKKLTYLEQAAQYPGEAIGWEGAILNE